MFVICFTILSHFSSIKFNSTSVKNTWKIMKLIWISLMMIQTNRLA